MKKTFSSKKSAFSLIELSIVLIVIGLLIAGITGGASLIRNSELRSAIGEARNYSVAVNAFYTQFNALPGDFNVEMYSGDTVGDNDGRIEYSNAASAAEGYLVWKDLSSIGAIDSDITTHTAVTSAPTLGTNYPASKINSAGWAFDYNATTGVEQNVVVLTGPISAGTSANTLVNGTVVSSGAVTTADALSIDTKADDGVANNGRIRAVSTDCATTTYDLTESAVVCALSYQIDANS